MNATDLMMDLALDLERRWGFFRVVEATLPRSAVAHAKEGVRYAVLASRPSEAALRDEHVSAAREHFDLAREAERAANGNTSIVDQLVSDAAPDVIACLDVSPTIAEPAPTPPTFDPDVVAGACAQAALGFQVIAVYYARSGVCACQDGEACEKPGKHPIGTAWQTKGTSDPEAVRARLSAQWCNAGLLMGGANRLVAIDIDGDEGRASVATLVSELGELPATWASHSGREDGGEHRVFRVPEGVAMPKNGAGILVAGVIRPGLDTRSTGGQIVAPGSMHATGRRYARVEGSPDEIATLPLAWAEALTKPAQRAPAPAPSPRAPRAPSASRAPGGDRYAEKALENAALEVQTAPDGSRNDTLNRESFAIGGFVGAGRLDGERVVAVLLEAIMSNGATDERREEKKIRDAMAKGASQPRHRDANEDEPSRAQAPSSEPPDVERESIRDEGDTPGAGHREGPSARPAPATPSSVVRAWMTEGPLVRVATGIRPLDELSRGGLPIPWRVTLVGAPSAGKTAVAIAVANTLSTVGNMCVGVLAVDEEPDDLTVRLAQIAGFTVAEAEERDPAVLREIESALADRRLRFYDASHTIESASRDLAAWATAENRYGALVLDSIQTVTSSAPGKRDTARAVVDANVAAVRVAHEQHRLLVVATSEANRASYRSNDAKDEVNDLASGAETRTIEFSAQTLLMLRTPTGEPDMVHVRVAKNRRATRGEFWLRLDRERHLLTPCPNPADDPGTAAQKGEERRATATAKVLADAKQVMDLVQRTPGMTVRGLRAAVQAAGLAMGVGRVDAAIVTAQRGVGVRRLVDRGQKKVDGSGPSAWHVESVSADGNDS